MNRKLLALFAVVVATAATVTGQGQEHVPVQESQCWSCHSPGNWNPPMDQVALVVPEATDLVAGPTNLGLRIHNGWIVQDRDFQLSEFTVSLNIAEAPSMRFRSDQRPVAVGPIEGTVAYDPVSQANPDDVFGLPDYLERDHRGHIQIDVPDGATRLTLEVTPEDTVGPGPDLAVHIHAGDEPGIRPAFTVDAAGPGETETIEVSGADFGALGYGTWTIEVSTHPNDANNGRVGTGDIEFVVAGQASFELDEATLAVAGSDAEVMSGESVLLDWPVELVGTPLPGERVVGILNVTGHYRHDGIEPDWAWFTIPFEVPLHDGTAPAWGLAGTVVAFQEPPGISLATVSEVIGYMTAALMLLSMWSGGIFGRASRGRLNRIFGTAKRRVAFHNLLSYGIILFALIHFVVFLVEINYHWLHGILWGGASILSLLGLGVTGALQVPMIRRWDYATWKWTHFGMAIAAVAFALVHVLLDGTHFGSVQEAVGWVDPLVPMERQ